MAANPHIGPVNQVTRTQILEERIKVLERQLPLGQERIEWLEKGLSDIANSRDDMNPLHLKQMAQSTLDLQPTTVESYDEHLEKRLNAFRSRMNFGGDTGTDADFEEEWYNDRIKLRTEQEESEKRMKALHRGVFESQG